MRSYLTPLITVVAWLVVFLASGAHAARADALEQQLKNALPLSQIALTPPAREGVVVEKGTVLVLEADGVPANRLSVLRVPVYSPRDGIANPMVHLRNYARVEISNDGRISGERGQLTLNRGTRLVVLDLTVKKDGVHLFAHTAAPVRTPDGGAAYGCTEFVFPMGPETYERTDASKVLAVIERWLKPAA